MKERIAIRNKLLSTVGRETGFDFLDGRGQKQVGDPAFERVSPSSLKTEEWMTTEEAADFLRVSAASLLNLSSNGKIPYYKFQRRNRYLKSDLLSLLLSTKKGAFNGS